MVTHSLAQRRSVIRNDSQGKKNKPRTKKVPSVSVPSNKLPQELIVASSQRSAQIRSESQDKENNPRTMEVPKISVLSNKIPQELIVTSSQLRLQDCIGQGK